MTGVHLSRHIDSTVLDKTLRINEIFLSLQGETSRSGLPTIFIRLTGCPLRCIYCDTAYAFHEGEKYTVSGIMDRLSDYRASYITVTGGEPLAQPNCRPLLTHLCNEGYNVSLETGGAMDITEVDNRVKTILDIKTPASGEAAKNRWSNLEHLKQGDEVKFVICNRNDYDWSRKIVQERKLNERCEVLFSPEHTGQDATQLANWILEDMLPVRFQVQLHKYLWGDVPGK